MSFLFDIKTQRETTYALFLRSSICFGRIWFGRVNPLFKGRLNIGCNVAKQKKVKKLHTS